MSLWVDKHRPVTLEKLDYLKDQAAQLARLATTGDLPHLLFYGPSGAGKKTRIMALLRAIFGAGVEKVRGAGARGRGRRARTRARVAQPRAGPRRANTHPPPSVPHRR